MLLTIFIIILGLNAIIPRIKGISDGIKAKDKGRIKGESFFLTLTTLIWIGTIALSMK